MRMIMMIMMMMMLMLMLMLLPSAIRFGQTTNQLRPMCAGPGHGGAFVRGGGAHGRAHCGRDEEGTLFSGRMLGNPLWNPHALIIFIIYLNVGVDDKGMESIEIHF